MVIAAPPQSRIDAPGKLRYVIIRGIDRQAIFKDDTARDEFLKWRRFLGLT